MRPLIILTAVFAAVCAAPSGHYAGAPVVAAVHGVAPIAAIHAAPAAIHVPAPYTTSHVQGLPTTTLHKAPNVITKQLHFGSKDFISGHVSEILKPAIPDFRIAVPTALKGTHQVNAAIVKTIAEPHVVNEPFPVERRVEVPYDVPIYKEQLINVPRPYAVDRPYHVPVPVAVQGEPIIRVRENAPIIQRTHQNIHTEHVAQPVAIAQPIGYAHQAVIGHQAIGYGQQAFGYGHQGIGYGQQGVAIGYGQQGVPIGYGQQGVAIAAGLH